MGAMISPTQPWFATKGGSFVDAEVSQSGGEDGATITREHGETGKLMTSRMFARGHTSRHKNVRRNCLTGTNIWNRIEDGSWLFECVRSYSGAMLHMQVIG
jgi:hypothetical protein